MSMEESAGLFRDTGMPVVSCPETFGEDMVRPLISGREDPVSAMGLAPSSMPDARTLSACRWHER